MIYKNNNKIILFNKVVVNYNKKMIQIKFKLKINLINNKYKNNSHNKTFLLMYKIKIMNSNSSNNKLHFNR